MTRLSIREAEEKRDTKELTRYMESDVYGREAMEALGRLKDPRTVKALIATMENPKRPSELRVAAAAALGSISGGAAVKALITALQSWDTRVRQAAAVALGDAQDSAALKALHAAVEDREYQVRKSAREALQRLGDDSAELRPMPIRDLSETEKLAQQVRKACQEGARAEDRIEQILDRDENNVPADSLHDEVRVAAEVLRAMRAGLLEQGGPERLRKVAALASATMKAGERRFLKDLWPEA